MKEKEIKRIMKKYKKSFDILEEYDRTGKLPKEIKEKGKEFEVKNKQLLI